MKDVTLHSLDKKIDIIIYQNEELNKRLNCVETDINGNGKKGLKQVVSEHGVFWKITIGIVSGIIVPVLIYAVTH